MRLWSSDPSREGSHGPRKAPRRKNALHSHGENAPKAHGLCGWERFPAERPERPPTSRAFCAHFSPTFSKGAWPLHFHLAKRRELSYLTFLHTVIPAEYQQIELEKRASITDRSLSREQNPGQNRDRANHDERAQNIPLAGRQQERARRGKIRGQRGAAMASRSAMISSWRSTGSAGHGLQTSRQRGQEGHLAECFAYAAVCGNHREQSTCAACTCCCAAEPCAGGTLPRGRRQRPSRPKRLCLSAQWA